MTWELKLEVDFDTDPGDEPSAWVDLTDRITVPVTTAARSAVGGTVSAGETRVTLKSWDRALDPTNPAAPFNLVPMRHARLTVDIGGTTHPLFRGYVEDWVPQWPQWNDGKVDVRLVDAFAWLALQDADVDLPRQDTDERIDALLDLAGWPTTLRNIAPGVITVEADEREGANLLRLVLDTADTEEGELHVDPDGRLTFASRHARFDAVSDLTVGPDRTTKVDPSYGAATIANVARTELADGDVFEAADLASVASYGRRIETVRDLSILGVEAAAIAEWTVLRFAHPTLWLDGLTVDSRTDAELAEVVGRRIGDLVTFTHVPPGGGTVEVVGHIEEIRHQVVVGAWLTTWALSPYFGAGPWFELDASQLDSDHKLAP